MGKRLAKLFISGFWDAPKQRGQVALEYVLVLAVIVGIFLVVARPGLEKIRQKLLEGVQSSSFGGGGGEPNFYYYPMR